MSLNLLPRTPSVTVVVPLYNAAAFIGAAIESILAQTVPVTEIVVVDDESSDDSASIAGGYSGVRVIRKDHSGAADTINRGVSEAQGEYLTFLDADDLWSSDKLEKQLALLLAPQPPDLVFGHAQNFHSPELEEEVRRSIYCPPDPMEGYVAGTLMARRDDITRVGLFDPALKIGYMVDWYGRAQDLGLTTVLHPDVLLRRRLHADNLSRREPARRPDFARALKAVLDRRRARSAGTDTGLGPKT